MSETNQITGTPGESAEPILHSGFGAPKAPCKDCPDKKDEPKPEGESE